MHRNAITIQRFYEALQAGDGEAMAGAYHADAVFRDPVFSLRGSDVGDMWRMFCSAGAGLRVDFSSVEADDTVGSAHWEPHYTFRPTGRSVHNSIDARFEFDSQGLVLRHKDEFNLNSWARQALGLPGVLLGWTPMLKNRIRRQAALQLERYQRRSREADQGDE